MSIVYLKNFRKGFATNSSSTHSLIYRNKEDMLNDLNVFELNYYGRFTNTIAATKKAKIKYVAANVMYYEPLLTALCAFYPTMKQYLPLIKKQKKYNNSGTWNEEAFGMCERGELYFKNSINFEASLDYIRNIIDNDEIIIVGGSDEEDFVNDVIKKCQKLPKGEEIDYFYRHKDKPMVFKNGNYWFGYGLAGDKLRFSITKDANTPQYPELIDLKITNKCNNKCQFCYMDSNMKGKHADIKFLKTIIQSLSYDENYERRIEFSVGGGNVILYPHLEDLFRYMKEHKHIINTTVNARDLHTITSNKKLFKLFEECVNGIGISVSNDEDVELVKNFVKPFDNKKGLYKNYIIHLIPEYLGVEKTRKYCTELSGYYNFLFLGYKMNGRGQNITPYTFTNKELKILFDGFYNISLDTSFASKYYTWLKDNFETEHTITLNEGEYSMYIDGITQNAYKSSYQLDKPYNLTRGKWDEKNETWYTPEGAFTHIREDNGFKIYK